MKNYEKIIIPLIDDKLTLDDISEKVGFVGVYTEDIDRPYLDNHIFIMYDYSNTVEFNKIFYKFRALKSFYNYKLVYIDGKAKVIFAFTTNFFIKNILSGGWILGDDNRLRILRFWQFTDGWVDLNVIRGEVSFDPISEVLPASDYISD